MDADYLYWICGDCFRKISSNVRGKDSYGERACQICGNVDKCDLVTRDVIDELEFQAGLAPQRDPF